MLSRRAFVARCAALLSALPVAMGLKAKADSSLGHTTYISDYVDFIPRGVPMWTTKKRAGIAKSTYPPVARGSDGMLTTTVFDASQCGDWTTAFGKPRA